MQLTKPKSNSISDKEDRRPPQEYIQPKTTPVMAAILDTSILEDDVLEILDKNYLDLTGQFPRQSLTGNKYILVVYAYAPNAILMEALTSRQEGEIIRGYATLCEYLKDRGYQAQFAVMDNEVSKKLKEYITREAKS